ncbi:hypothetical protein Lfu02_53700 [Longispora fulva]|uniref:Uncharacterized protein n=1 Tax=Longispora fulva TaxID=619741 RepID=A0A8J7GP96_9ACTN|nr:hypothetical protein [Longispora fulva]MBG6140738.1 hypothetical protein [Longispora fulva]GIG60998.1 hypothetical protein Lfu02_53700 [Longispora fulva]
MHLVTLALVHPDPAELEPSTVTEILWSHTTPADGVEHVRTRVRSDRYDIAVFLIADGEEQALATARDLCDRAVAASPILRSCRLTN